MNNLRIGFIGGGKMAQALCSGFIRAQMVKPSQILTSDLDANCRNSFIKLGAQVTQDNQELVDDNDVVFLAVKPPIMPKVLKEISEVATPNQLFVSIAAGLSTTNIEDELPPQCRVVRVMPNLPCVVQAGASVFAKGGYATDIDGTIVKKLLGCAGLVEEVVESQIDAITGLSGSGPAYAFTIIQSLADGGVRMGVPRAQATRLAAQVLLGAAKMVLEGEGHPEELKDMVCSPGGTSIYGVQQLEEGGLRGSLIAAVESASNRAIQLGEESDAKAAAAAQEDKPSQVIHLEDLSDIKLLEKLRLMAANKKN